MLKTPNVASQLGEQQIHGLNHGRSAASKNKELQEDVKVIREDSIELSQEGIVRLRRRQADEIATQNLLASGSTLESFQSAQELLSGFELELAG